MIIEVTFPENTDTDGNFPREGFDYIFSNFQIILQTVLYKIA